MNTFFSKKIIAREGVATLPTIIALSILILAISIGIAASSFSELFISQGQSQSSQAYEYAEAGIRDALHRVAIDKNASSTYSISFAINGCSSNTACASITISNGVGSSGDPKIITSSGQSGNFVRRLQTGILFDVSLNGEIATTTWQEITTP
ncbi:MAG: hypothetical protein WCV80_00705 [Candidatus Paceibacterota bacterium]|jgi:Tfp pilus assembly protein PilX